MTIVALTIRLHSGIMTVLSQSIMAHEQVSQVAVGPRYVITSGPGMK